ncbi:hypothetical protein J5N97_010063 [Dioscorea zingiberensis]|uniref:Homeobox domain-containing protein n=1 Tax=Dioscorea zingiberensis TaxID=325984 RepID=A0A9D5CYP7_9LILI|nr:hypothetical protein J5N97_010063 [Dioscorea zingiberensis]
MGIARPQSQPTCSLLSPTKPVRGFSSLSSMSQGFHQGIFSFSDGFDRSGSQDQQQQQQQQQQHHIAQQSRREKLRVQQGFDPAGHPLVTPLEEGEDPGIYETPGAGNMLSEMFNFPTPGPSATELLANQIPASFRLPQRPSTISGFSGDWYGGTRQGMVIGSSSLSPLGDTPSKHPHDTGQQQQPQHAIQGLNADSAAAMQLFLMSPPTGQTQHTRSPSPPPPAPPPSLHHHHAFQTPSFAETSFRRGTVVEGQGLSLSLASNLQQFEMAKAEELRVRDGVLYFNNQQQQQQPQQSHPHPSSLHLQGHGQHGPPSGHGHGHGQHVHMGYGPMGVVNVLRSSKYARPAQELLEEFCSVGRGQLKGSRIGRHHHGSSNPNNPSASASAAAAGASSSSSKDVPPALSPADRFEHQRKKAKLLSMLDEVDRRYNHYCDQMQMVVNSFDAVMGFGAATPYTALAQKAMSRHFRCLKDAIVAQLKQTCELLGEKDGGSSSGITKGETPRLKLLDQSLRQQRAFHQMGMMEQEAWRPQRGLPERSVNILRAWLFEHFLHPYPSDADKHLLARQTGLSRNQVSNWFINARVRLWKPMVEEMYQQEAKDEGEDREQGEGSHQRQQSPTQQQQQQHQRPENNAPENDPSLVPTSISMHQRNPPDPAPSMSHQSSTDDAILAATELCGPDAHVGPGDDVFRMADYGVASALGPAATRMMFGTAGDVSLTLGLRHTSNTSSAPETNRFSIRDFGG